MIEYLKGTLTISTPCKTVLEINGIGYRIHIPLSNFAKLPSLGSPLCLFISEVLREDSHKYYGFLTQEERDLFDTLIEVSGIGPKTALALLGHLEASSLQHAISKSDVSLLCKAPGIGKKTAERLIVEMRDRFQKAPVGIHLPPQHSTLFEDALRALINLGYPSPQAQKALQASLNIHQEETDLAKLITSALRHI